MQEGVLQNLFGMCQKSPPAEIPLILYTLGMTFGCPDSCKYSHTNLKLCLTANTSRPQSIELTQKLCNQLDGETSSVFALSANLGLKDLVPEVFFWTAACLWQESSSQVFLPSEPLTRTYLAVYIAHSFQKTVEKGSKSLGTSFGLNNRSILFLGVSRACSYFPYRDRKSAVKKRDPTI